MKLFPLGFLIGLTVLGSCEQQLQTQNVEVVDSSVIIGRDDRRPSPDENTIYTRRAGLLVSHFPGNKVVTCSATAIGQNHILSAAHCFYNDQGAITTRAFFYPGITEPMTMPRKRFQVKLLHQPWDYYPDDQRFERFYYDIAIAEVDIDEDGFTLGRRVGHHGYWGIRNFTQAPLTVYGYPGDKGGYAQYYQEDCDTEVYNSFLLSTKCDVYRGQSGSAAFMKHPDQNNFFAIGVVSGESPESMQNFITRITPDRQKIIDALTRTGAGLDSLPLGTERWFSDSSVYQPTSRVLVKNICDRQETLHAATYALRDNGEWKVEGFYEILPGKTVELVNSTNPNYRLAVLTPNGRSLVRERYRMSVPGSNGHFIFNEGRVDGAKDKTYAFLTCR